MENFNYVWKLLVITAVAVMSISMFAMADESDGIASNVVVVQIEKVSLIAGQSIAAPSSCTAYFQGTLNASSCRAGEVPLQAATWLFILALIAFVGLSNKRKV